MSGTQPIMYVDDLKTADPLPDIDILPVDIAEFTRYLTSNQQQPQPSLLSMARLYGYLRGIPGIWQAMISELLQLRSYGINELAEDVNVSPRTIKRILHNHTSNPCIETSFRLFFLHVQRCPHRYRGKDNILQIEGL